MFIRFEDNLIGSIEGLDQSLPSLFVTEDERLFTGGLVRDTGASTATVTLTLSNDNEAPVFGPETSFAVPGNERIVGAMTATDPDSIELSVALADGGDDNALFSIDAETGALSFLTPPDFETPADADGDNIYRLLVSISDGQATAAVSRPMKIRPSPRPWSLAMTAMRTGMI